MNVRALVLRTYATIMGLLTVVALMECLVPGASGDTGGSADCAAARLKTIWPEAP
jgi:hypothetical protein